MGRLRAASVLNTDFSKKKNNSKVLKKCLKLKKLILKKNLNMRILTRKKIHLQIS